MGRRATVPIPMELAWGKGIWFPSSYWIFKVSQILRITTRTKKAFMLLSPWTKGSHSYPQFPFLPPPLHPHLVLWLSTAATTEMSCQCQVLQEEMETHSRHLEEEVRSLQEQLGKLPNLSALSLRGSLRRSSLKG